MKFTTQAPIGGRVSPVNGQFYVGGQFMPDHGLFCGLHPRKQLKILNHALAARFSGRHEKVVREDDGYRYMYRESVFSKWIEGCIRSTLVELAAVLEIQP